MTFRTWTQESLTMHTTLGLSLLVALLGAKNLSAGQQQEGPVCLVNLHMSENCLDWDDTEKAEMCTALREEQCPGKTYDDSSICVTVGNTNPQQYVLECHYVD